VLRLAELYLIRAESRINQGKLLLAIEDIDKIRQRAGLPLIENTNPGINSIQLMLQLQKEKRTEFFAEWGHRWLDLKRWNKADAILKYKSGWAASVVLFPIPSPELNKNPNLKPQHSGY
jgi:hypothetical protein